MEANELSNQLRNSNLIKYMGKPIKVSIETIFAISKCVGETAMYQPIQLTEEWLLKCGFEKKTYAHLTLYYFSLKVLSHGEISFHPKENGFNIDLGTTTGYQFGTTNIKYVHQLQNLYFALTGEELTVNI